VVEAASAVDAVSTAVIWAASVTDNLTATDAYSVTQVGDGSAKETGMIVNVGRLMNRSGNA
jgi:hypothetical protein